MPICAVCDTSYERDPKVPCDCGYSNSGADAFYDERQMLLAKRRTWLANGKDWPKDESDEELDRD